MSARDDYPLLAGWAQFKTGRKAEPPSIECDFCCAIVMGAPGGWHDEMGFETCADSPTSFHEHSVAVSSPSEPTSVEDAS